MVMTRGKDFSSSLRDTVPARYRVHGDAVVDCVAPVVNVGMGMASSIGRGRSCLDDCWVLCLLWIESAISFRQARW